MKSNEFNFTNEDFLSIVNLICKLDTPMGEEYIPLTSMKESVNLEWLDSLSIIVFFVWISSLFGISEAKMQEFLEKKNFTVQAIKDFVKAEATQTYSYAEAKAYTEKCF